MDSGNSGSLQSSSGGDEEYDSRAAVSDSISAYVSANQTPGHVTNPPPPPFFDPISNYMQSTNPPLLNPNLTWPRTQVPDPNPTNHHDIMMINSNHNPTSAPFFQLPDNNYTNNNTAATAPQQQNMNNPPAARNPKKRSRASRRAPTTVLTTDTSNFRAMVQEFTGIPAPPFTTTTRLDLFANPPPYLRRPFPHKPSPQFISSATNNNSSHASSSSMAPIDFQQPSGIAQSSNLFNIGPNNPLLTSLLQTNPKFLFHPGSSDSPKMPPSSGGDDTKIMDGFDHGFGLPNLVYSTDRDQVAKGDGYDQMRPENVVATRGGGGSAEGMVESWICSAELK